MVMSAPSPRLLSLHHRAIAHILHLSAGGEYIDEVLQNFDETGVQEDDESTDLGCICLVAYAVLKGRSFSVSQRLKIECNTAPRGEEASTLTSVNKLLARLFRVRFAEPKF
ncbi:hypothetical protein BDFG_02195 [Blastomyces dermatitidis ATCC 26199]|nr:hypothetical protein BDFG_02195 [Blastomyces dermatitidis ATCC 26199]